MAAGLPQTLPLGERDVGVFTGVSESLLDQSALPLLTADPRAAPAAILPPWARELALSPSLCSLGLS